MLRTLFLVPLAVLAGGSLATSPYLENAPCQFAPHDWPVIGSSEFGWQSYAQNLQAWPPGQRCEFGLGNATRVDFLGPTALETLVVIGLVGLVLFAAARRPGSPALTGAAIATAFLALYAFVSLWIGPQGAVFGLFVLWPVALLGLAWQTRSAVTAFTVTTVIPTTTFFAWGFVWLWGFGHAATALGILVGALTAMLLDRSVHLGRRAFPANEFATN